MKNIKMLTETQIKRKASAKIKRYVANMPGHVQYYFIRGIFHINNVDTLNSAKTICEAATGIPFTHMTNSMCKIDFKKLE
jgi:hypothetical protein